MKFFNLSPVVAIFIALSSAPAWATDAPTTIGCSAGTTPASIELEAIATAQSTCPLLEKKELKKLVDRFGAGTIFAYPLIPYTCVSGTITKGTIAGWQIDSAKSFSESAQRLFPVPQGPGQDGFNLFATSADSTLSAGAAMTALHLEARGHILNLLVDDHFLVTYSVSDTEDFLVVGSQGDYIVSGRLTGRGQITANQPLTIAFTVNGTVCLK